MKKTLNIDHKTNLKLLNVSENMKKPRRAKLLDKMGESLAQNTSSLQSHSEVFEDDWEVTYHEIVIIIISSSLSVILIITAISVIIVKVS